MYLYGASGHCKVIIDSIQSATAKKIKGVFDDHSKDETILGVPIIKFNNFDKHAIDELIISIGDNKIRKKLATTIQANFTSVIHKQAIVSKYATIDIGSVIMPNAVINASSKIGKHCIINTGAIIEHDCIIEDYVHISPNATITGGIKIGEGTHVGAGAVVIPNIKIGKWTTVGAGAVVVNDVPDYAVVVGNPAKIIKYNKPK